MAILMAAGLTWLLLSVPVALAVGRGIRLADDEAVDPCAGVERYLREQAAASTA
jgi:hypothetical protein